MAFVRMDVCPLRIARPTEQSGRPNGLRSSDALDTSSVSRVGVGNAYSCSEDGLWLTQDATRFGGASPGARARYVLPSGPVARPAASVRQPPALGQALRSLGTRSPRVSGCARRLALGACRCPA